LSTFARSGVPHLLHVYLTGPLNLPLSPRAVCTLHHACYVSVADHRIRPLGPRFRTSFTRYDPGACPRARHYLAGKIYWAGRHSPACFTHATHGPRSSAVAKPAFPLPGRRITIQLGKSQAVVVLLLTSQTVTTSRWPAPPNPVHTQWSDGFYPIFGVTPILWRWEPWCFLVFSHRSSPTFR